MTYGKKAIIFILTGILITVLTLALLTAATFDIKSADTVLGIMYHQVLKDKSVAGEYVVTYEELEADFKWLRDNNYTSYLPSEIKAIRQNGGMLSKKAVILSFDDGYETGLEYVLPLLQKYQLKATINIVGDYTDKYSELSQKEKNLSYSYLTWEEIARLSQYKNQIEIGLHTYSMHGFDSTRQGCGKNPGETDEEYRAILYSDTARLINKLGEYGVFPTSFAFPYGIISQGAVDTIKSTGIDIFMTCREAPTIINDDTIIINRYNRAGGRAIADIDKLYLSQAEGI